MARSIVRTALIALLLAGWALALASLHIVRLPDGMIGVVPKNRLGVTDTYVDVRNWTAADAAKHPDFVKRLLEARKADWLATAVGVPADALDAKLNELLTAPAEPTTKPDARVEAKPAKPRAKPGRAVH